MYLLKITLDQVTVKLANTFDLGKFCFKYGLDIITIVCLIIPVGEHKIWIHFNYTVTSATLGAQSVWLYPLAILEVQQYKVHKGWLRLIIDQRV